MTDTTPSASSVVYGVFDGSRALPASLTPADAGAAGDLIRSVPSSSMPVHPLLAPAPSPPP